VDWKGQIITMADRAYLTAAMPMCVIWGKDDAVIPVSHADIAASIAPGADIEIVDNAGHFVHKDHPERFVKLLNDFVRTTEPASHDRSDWRELLTHGPDTPAVRELAGERPLRPVARLTWRRTKSA
jgi:hypothetical protein